MRCWSEMQAGNVAFSVKSDDDVQHPFCEITGDRDDVIGDLLRDGNG